MTSMPREDKTINQEPKSTMNMEKRSGRQQMTMTKDSGRHSLIREYVNSQLTEDTRTLESPNFGSGYCTWQNLKKTITI